ncbi:hypothetical protein GA0115239_107117 [Streptomyces sp. BpilaLS-43]|uniref:hypothetical protein n=1 Tax=Streptomyces sp. BpilaLS-43 TaxID=1839778 RepID=UPI00081BABA0|nr:hypothetical protein [Streptomyces sp. BpilaLS-43]SCD74505.1 hypothetical protein GA0115239_107117 [Streptomyces sp. BpilaLS-43]
MIPRRSHLRAARGRLEARAAALRSWLILRVFLPRRSRHTARLKYAAVLDGQTVNLHAELPRSVRLPDHAELVLTRGRRHHESPARVYEGGDGTLLMDAAVLLGAEVGGAPVDPGRWQVRLRLRTGSRTRRIPLLLVELPTPYEGPTKPMTASGVTGRRHRIGRSVTGNMRVVTAVAKPGAEVVKVHITHAGISVDFRLLGIRIDEPEAEFIASGRRLRQPVTVLADGTARVEVPLEGMAPRRSRPEHWDVAVTGASGRAFRLGRRLHDVRNPLRVFAMRATAIAPRGQRPLLVQPRYTPAGNLRITCTPMPEIG